MRNLLLVCLLILSVSIYCESQKTGQQILYDSLLNMKTKEAFKMWHYLEDKKYLLNTELGLSKYRVFKDNVKYIKQRNAELVDYQLGIGPFTDLTFEEYKAILLNEKRFQSGKDKLRNLAEINFDEMADAAEEETKVNGFHDWSSDFVGVRNQGSCGSCWAFSTTGAIEGALSNKQGRYAALSPQHLVDCDTTNYGCDGGLFDGAFQFAYERGIAYDADYKYTAMVGQCRSGLATTKLRGIRYCSNYHGKSCASGTDSCQNLLSVAPLSVGIDAGTRDFQNYKNGIYSAACANDNHAVVMVYMDSTSVKIRNSWGGAWGENGYIRVSRNSNNRNSCFTENECYAPVL